MGIKPTTFASIKAASLSTVVEKLGGGLKRVGHEFLTQCLWHDDANPSLTINDQKGFCFCHVCRAGGDAVDYVRKAKGMEFREAVEFTAELLNVKFETDDENPEAIARRKAERAAEHSRLEAQQKVFTANLHDPRAKNVRLILKGRGITKAAAVEFGIGYSAQGFFSGRITIPIYNHQDKLVGFTGRTTKDDPAKYKNSADSALFSKKLLIFNEQRAYKYAAEAGSLIFVEGHLDVVAMWQAGIKNVVAAQGTGAPDPLVLKRLSRNIKTFILCFDGDAGGRKAVEQFISVAGPMAQKGECSINVASLPEGSDPDDLIRSGADLYHYIASAPSWLDWTIDTWAAALDKTDTAMITAVEQKLRSLIDGLRSKALRTHYIDKSARVLSSTDKEAKLLSQSWGQRVLHVTETDSWSPREPHDVRLAAERRLLRTFVHAPQLREELRPLLEHVTNPALRWLCERLRELEEYSSVDLTPWSLMAVVAVSEPHFMKQLRNLIRPNVIIDVNDGVINHLADIMGKELSNDTHGPNPDQSLTG